MKLILLLLISVFLARPASAEGISTIGNIDCGNWVAAREAKSSMIYESYMNGFINGLALGKRIEFWEAKGIPVSPEQAFLWLDKYCRENPLSVPITGVFRLFDERVE